MSARIVTCCLAVTILLIAPQVLAGNVPAVSGPAMDCRGSVSALSMQGYKCSCVGGQLSCTSGSIKNSAGSKSISSAASMKSAVVGGILGGLLSSMANPPKRDSDGQYNTLLKQYQSTAAAARQAEQWREARDEEFRASRDMLAGGFKQPDGGTGEGNRAGLDFKTLDGPLETMAARAGSTFDTPSELPKPDKVTPGSATPFFGDTMPEAELRVLVDPEIDPRVVDLGKAVHFVAESLKNEATSREVKKQPVTPQETGRPIMAPPDCAGLTKQLGAYLEQRNKFQKTIHLAQSQLTEWQTMNRAALVNAAKDGIEFYTGKLFESLANRGKAAERIQLIYTRNAPRMAEEGIDILALEGKIQRLQLLSSAGKAAEVTSSINDWQTFIKHGMSGLLLQLTASNDDLDEILADPKMQKYFDRDAPELKALLDITKISASNKVFGKWLAKHMPIVAGIELAINQTYNGMEWGYSFNRLVKAHRINGQVTESARSLQKRIEQTRGALLGC